MRWFPLVAALTAGCLEAPASAPAVDAGPIECVCPADPCPFGFARAIRVTPALAVAEELSDLPVLVRFETSERMAADGSDLRFAASSGSLLAHEIELFPPPGGSAAVWVGVPLIPAGGEARFCMFYGAETPGAAPDPTGVWDSGFAAVWHLGETATGSNDEFADSTSRGCSGLGGAGAPDMLPERVAARVGNGQAFADDDCITFGIGSHLDAGTAITLETWVLIPAFGADYMALISKEGFFSGYRLLVGAAGEVLFQLTNAERRIETDAGSAVMGSWHHIAATYDGDQMAVFIDGALAETKLGTGSIVANEVSLRLGHGEDEYPLSGILDEVRISLVARTAGWIAAQRAMMIGEGVSVGPEEPL